MLPMPETRVWSSRARLMPVRRRRTAATKAASSKARSTGSRAMWAISAGSSAPPAEIDRPPNVRWATNRRCGPAATAARVGAGDGSGIGVFGGAGAGVGGFLGAGVQGLPGQFGGALLGLLLAAALAVAEALAGHHRPGGEGLGVVGAGLLDAVLGD